MKARNTYYQGNILMETNRYVDPTGGNNDKVSLIVREDNNSGAEYSAVEMDVVAAAEFALGIIGICWEIARDQMGPILEMAKALGYLDESTEDGNADQG